ncbi:Gfo/Idh/MocA family oxidoreductase [bacterium]|nr:Gfo/Idh/MocA family oxidoreductase [bacterium]
MSKKIRVGFIGAGGIAGAHIKWLKPVANVEVVALSDPSTKAMAAQIAEHELDGCKTFTDYTQMLKMKDIDAVSVCTPNWLHYKPTVAALKAGKHVMVEKPMAMNAREAQKMVDVAKARGRVLTIGFQMRFRPDTQFVKRAIDEGQLGDILYVRVQALRRRGIPSWGVFGRKDLQGGGPLIDIGVHIIEMSHYLMGKPKPVAASAVTHTYMGDKKPDATSNWGPWDHKTYTVEDLAAGFVRFDNGMTMSVEATFAAHIEEDVFGTTLMGTKGGASIGFGPPKVFTDWCGKMVNMEPKVVGKDENFSVKMRSWIETIRGAKNPAPGEDGVMVQKILDGLYRSGERGREVAIK